MANSKADQTGVCIEIAGFGLRLETDDVFLSEALKRRYSPFLSEAEAASVRVALQVIWVDTGSNAEIDPQMHADGMTFSKGRCQGWVDLRRGLGEMELRSPVPLREIDYFLRLIYALQGYRSGGFLLHSAGIMHRGWAFTFFGPSGSGKTTVARASLPRTILSDDLVLLLPEEGIWRAHATPFWNPSEMQPRPGSGWLGGLFRLEQDQRVQFEPLRRSEALGEVIACAPAIPRNPDLAAGLIERASTLLKAVPAYRMHFLPDGTFWEAIERLMEEIELKEPDR